MKLTHKKYLAAVSGGPDSMSLLDKYKQLIVGVCHVNYHKRSDSDVDTKIVVDYCSNHHIPVAIYDVDKKTYKSSKQHNFQTLARNIRYEFFVQCSKKFKCNNLLIAHNLNDFLETAMMQEKRHSQNFYYGIREINTYKNLNIYRPLIQEFKSDLEKYCRKNGIRYAIDSSNALDIYERNRIRKQLSKLSKKQLLALYKKFCKRNKKQAKIEQQTKKYLTSWAKTSYSVDYFKKIKPQYLDQVVYLYLKNNNIEINYNKIKLVRDYIVSKQSNNSLRLGNKIRLQKKNRKIKVVC